MININSIQIPPRAARILSTLREAGHEAYIVGGCVRDSLLGRVPGDWDITTSAKPEEVKALFRRTVDTGIQHGTVTVMLGSESCEVTTFRVEGGYTDARHPDEVRFVSSLMEDLSRRDFTVNAMAYAPGAGLIDAFGGLKDLENKVIRAVGDPRERFTEDALRMLRAVRFSAQLGFSIEPATFSAIPPLAGRLALISRERIRDEINKLLLSDHPEYFEILSECGISSVIMPRFDQMLATPQHSKFHLFDVGHHTLAVMKASPPTLLQRLCALLHDTGKVDTRMTDGDGLDHFKGHPFLSERFARDFLKDFRYDNKTSDLVMRLIRSHDIRIHPSLPNVRRLISAVGEDLFEDFLLFIQADDEGKSELAHKEFIPRFQKLCEAYQTVRERQDPLSLRDLALTGSDLISAGMPAGPAMGRVMRDMLDDILREPSHNNREYLLARYAGDNPPPPPPAPFLTIWEEIRKYEIIILPAPSDPDEDGIRAQIALKELVKESFPEKNVYLTGERSPAFARIPGFRRDPVCEAVFPLAFFLAAGADSAADLDEPFRQLAHAAFLPAKKGEACRAVRQFIKALSLPVNEKILTALKESEA